MGLVGRWLPTASLLLGLGGGPILSGGPVSALEGTAVLRDLERSEAQVGTVRLRDAVSAREEIYPAERLRHALDRPDKLKSALAVQLRLGAHPNRHWESAVIVNTALSTV